MSTNYETIKVSAGGRFSKSMSAGETFENKLIDITASNSNFTINTHGRSCTIRNIGIRGKATQANADLIAYASSSGGNVLVENIYRGDGHTATTYPNGNPGVFVPPSHAGTLTIRNLNYQDNPSNGVYGSSPGNPREHSAPGAGGQVIIEDSYSRNHSSAGFRLGTNDSYARNCVAVGGNRGAWAYFNNPDYIGCDFTRANIGDVHAGNGSWSITGNAHMTDCYWQKVGSSGGGRVYGSPVARTPRTQPSEVEGVPLTPEEAASGTSSGESPTPTPSPDVSPADGDYWGVNPNSEGDTQRLGSIEVHDRHPFGHGPE